MRHLQVCGSSPLTRGKLLRRRGRFAPLRLIPAHAGKTSRPCSAPAAGAAHPRSRGENPAPRPTRATSPGSSPLTRGKPLRKQRTCLLVGLIPAHAGKTTSTTVADTDRPAHPRSRGENPKSPSNSLLDPGSSPLTRGKPRVAWSPSTPRSAHPRSRGENGVGEEEFHRGTGSSPLTRGKLEVRLLGRRGLGLIPAHAGKTFAPTPKSIHGEAHPRSRGENARNAATRARIQGSSPLTRGKRLWP